MAPTQIVEQKPSPRNTATPSKKKVVSRVELLRERGYIYFVDKDGDISRTQRSDGHHRDRFPHQKVLRVGISRRPGYWYYLRAGK
jgi:hypothetical protein